MREDRFLRGGIVRPLSCSPHKKGDFFMQKNRHLNTAQSIKRLVIAALFCALAYAAMFVTSWIKVAFLTFDAKDTIITIAGLLFGPVYSLVISLVVSLIEFITVGDTGFWGFLMNFLSSAAFSSTCALIYKYKKNITGAVIGLAVSVVSMTAMMVLLNLLVTPIYTGMPAADVAAMIPTLFLPFNLTKATMNAALTLMLYKPVSRALKAAKITDVSDALTEKTKKESDSNKKSSLLTNLLVMSIGLFFVALSVVIFIVVLGGNFSFVA